MDFSGVAAGFENVRKRPKTPYIRNGLVVQSVPLNFSDSDEPINRENMISNTAREDELRSHFSATSTELRPIVTSLNGDNSWLWSFPRPLVEQASTGKSYYHVVFEPWLNGPTSELTSWGIHISLSEPPAVTSAQDVEAIIRQIEAAAAANGATQSLTQTATTNCEGYESVIDAILIGFHYLDHLHEPTLLTFDKRIPVIASKEAAAKLKQIDHFDTVKLISDFDPDATRWNAPDLHPGGFPTWLTPLRMTGHHELNYCLALIWTHGDVHEVMFQSPHGTRLDQGPLQAFLSSEPPTKKLAMFHGLKESHAAGSKNTYGAEYGLSFFRRVGGMRYWITTHDSPLQYAGIIMRMLWVRDTPRTLDWALEKEATNDDREIKSPKAKPNLIVVENGGMQVLE